MPEQRDLRRELRELGRSLPTPVARGLESAVMARIGERAKRRSAGPRARLVAIGVALIVALLAAPPVRAAIADWFGFGAVVVRLDDGGDSRNTPVTPPPVGPAMSLADAAAQVDFVVFDLPALGRSTGVEVSADRRVVSAGWPEGIRLDQSSSLGYTFDKAARSVQRVSIRGREALWFADSHEVVLLDEAGAPIPDSRRPAGRTMIWKVGETTLRLEGELSLPRALEVAESARPVD